MHGAFAELAIETDVVVIGAGAAGLAAAQRLASRSLGVVVVEARERIGGRVWAADAAPAAVPAELGAEFIHGLAQFTRDLLREAGSAAIDTVGDSWALDERGELKPSIDFAAAAGIFEGSRTLPEDETVDRFLQRFASDDTMRATVASARAFVEGFDAADPAIASARAIADEWASGVDFSSARPLGGYRPMFDLLYETCANAGVHFCRSAIVRRIGWSRGSVTVEAREGKDRIRTITARAAIVTLPVGVLRHRGDSYEVRFEPDLPAAKRDALAHITMGNALKVALWFKTPFWERIRNARYRDAAFFRSARGPFPAYWMQVPVRTELVVAWVAGPKASALNHLSAQERIELALAGFGEVLGEQTLARNEFAGGATHDWECDPFSRGAYTYVTVGGAAARTVLAVPLDDTLFFAGEATSNDGQGGTVNGALETGRRAADQILASFGAGA